MIVPSLELLDGTPVLRTGDHHSPLDDREVEPLLRRLSVAGDVTLVDLNAVLNRGNNRPLLENLVRRYSCRVGGAIRDVETAWYWLEAGARKVVIGSGASEDLLSRLPRDRIVFAVDIVGDTVMANGWSTVLREAPTDRIVRFRELVGECLVTFGDREGTMLGLDLAAARSIKSATGDCPLTVAGGTASPEDVAAADELGIDVQVGRALLTGVLPLADGIMAPLLIRCPASLWPTVVVDEEDVALGLTWSNAASVREAVSTLSGVYFSRSRGLWRKGDTSGNSQELLGIRLDCDRDCLQFRVRQNGVGFCHRQTATCWGADHGLTRLLRRIRMRVSTHAPNSYTHELLRNGDLLRSKLVEEACELAGSCNVQDTVWEAADLLYFLCVFLVSKEVDVVDVYKELARRECGKR